MQQLSLGDVVARLSGVFEKTKTEGFSPQARAQVESILMPALDQYPDNPALWFYAGLLFNTIGWSALASGAWARSYELEPQPMVLANLGASLKNSAMPEHGRDLLKRAMAVIPWEESTVCNLLGSYVNEGNPWEGIRIGREALRRGLENPHFRFNLALLELEAGNFTPGFDHYAEGKHENRDLREYEGATRLTDERSGRLLVYGEQGIGDELMFATLLDEASRDFEIIFDHHPRLTRLYDSAPWADRVRRYPTRKAKSDWYKPGLVDHYCPIGDLARIYRRTPESFAWKGPYYHATPEAAGNREVLEAMAGGRQIVGLSLRGGTLKTSRTYRSIGIRDLEPLLALQNVMYVSLDYDDISDLLQGIIERYGEDKLLWFPSITWAWDYYHMADLIEATDRIVTVCQSAAHLSAAMGKETHVLVPHRAAWRYGLGRGEGEPVRQGEPWYWYPHSARTWRQDEAGWQTAVTKVQEVLLA